MQKVEQKSEPEELLRILHFNDVYDIEPGDKDPVGGVARFKTAIDSLRDQKTIVLFSGDAFSPSILSEIHKGEQMILPLNSLGIDVACLGNHDLDFAEEQALKLQKQTNFPWILSNFFYKGTTDRLLECKEFVILEKFGLKMGIFGLAEKQWIDTLNQYYHDKLDYVDFVEYAELMVQTLRQDHGCDFIVALTHMMGYNDTKLANAVTGIDLILGGHDHTIRSDQIKNVPVIKTGTNFKQLHLIKVNKSKENSHFHSQKYGIDIELIRITQDIRQDPVLEEHVKKHMKDIQHQNNKIGLMLEADVDLRFETIRKEQNPYMRLVTEWYLSYLPCDVALYNSGNQRNNSIHHEGPLLKKNIFNMCKDPIVAKRVTGAQLLDVFQNSVSMYPNLSGRFASFGGASFTWDSHKPAGSRVIVQSVKIKNKDFSLVDYYVLASHQFHSLGGDGFVSLRDAQYSFNPEQYLYNVEIHAKHIDAESQEAQEFARRNSQYYVIRQNQYGIKHIHFDPRKIPINVKMI